MMYSSNSKKFSKKRKLNPNKDDDFQLRSKKQKVQTTLDPVKNETTLKPKRKASKTKDETSFQQKKKRVVQSTITSKRNKRVKSQGMRQKKKKQHQSINTDHEEVVNTEQINYRTYPQTSINMKDIKNIKSKPLKQSQVVAIEKTEEQIKPDEVNSRTLFVGNVGITTKKEQLLHVFRPYGKIESIRFRGVTPADPKTPKRLAAIKCTFHPKRSSFYSYVVFKNREDAAKATELNGTKLNEHFIRVQLCDEDNNKLEPTKAIFIGNVPFDAEENDLWNTFEQYGKIVSVRLVRNSVTGMCIGIGFVNFESSDAVELVVMADSISIRNRELRIKRFAKPMNKKYKKGNRSRTFKTKPKENLSNSSSDQNKCYRGSKFVQQKKKKKANRKLKQNKMLIKKIAPR
ncbi:hypothetical protein FQR65_LT13073 [Abscondita terminalis]|nr:hypothetical protein FQR65_LT13073 [Abscondita terminalis]